jgi:hypothetical protein
MNSSMVGTQSSSFLSSEALVVLGPENGLVAWSTFRVLNGDDRLDPRIPTTFGGFPNSPNIKQLWMHLTWLVPTGTKMKFPSGCWATYSLKMFGFPANSLGRSSRNERSVPTMVLMGPDFSFPFSL